MNTYEAHYHFPEPEPVPEDSLPEGRHYLPDPEIGLPDEPSLDDTGQYFLHVLRRQQEVSANRADIFHIEGDLDQLLLNTFEGRAVHQMVENGELDKDRLGPDLWAGVREDITIGEVSEQKLVADALLLAYEIGLGSMGYHPEIVQKLDIHLMRSTTPLTPHITQQGDVRDRIQNATEGVLRTVYEYLKKQNMESMQEAIPLEEAAPIGGYRRLQKAVESAYIREQLGARATTVVVAKLRGLHQKYLTSDLSEVRRGWAGSREWFEELQRLQAIVTASEHLFWDEISFPYAAVEEAPEFEGEAADELSIDEIYPDVTAQVGFETVENIVSRDQKAAYLAAADEDQWRVLLDYHGFPVEGLPPGPRTMHLLADFYGTYYSRIWRRIQRAVKLLEHPVASHLMQEALMTNEPFSTSTNFSGDRLRTGRAAVRASTWPGAKKAADPEQPRPVMRPQWASRLDRLDAARASQGIILERPARGTARYYDIYSTLRDGLRSSIDSLRIAAEDARRMPYPAVCHELEEHMGAYMTADMVEDLWNLEIPQHLAARKVPRVNPDSMAQLVSRLLSVYMHEDDRIILKVSSHRRCNYLGAWIRRGSLTLKGAVGNYVGAHMSGNAVIIVQGKSGDYAGFGASGTSRLLLNDDTGRFVGAGASGQSTIIVKKEVRNPVGPKLRGQAKIVIELEGLEIKGPLYDIAQAEAVSDAGATQFLDFEEVASYFGLTMKQLEDYTRSIGHPAYSPLSSKELLELKQRWPKLGS